MKKIIFRIMNRLIRNRDFFVIILLILIICLFNIHISHGNRVQKNQIPLIRYPDSSKSNLNQDLNNHSSQFSGLNQINNHQNNDTNSSTIVESVTSMPEYDKQVFFNEIISSRDYWKICSNLKIPRPNVSVEESFFNMNNFTECPTGSFIVFLVMSHIQNFGLREKIRQSWSSIRQLRESKLTTLFFVYSDKPINTSQMDALKSENDQYFDVVYIPIKYSLKTEVDIYLKMLEFAVISCQEAANFVLINDGVFVNIPALFEAILTHNDIRSSTFEKRSLFMCNVKKNVIVVRNKKSNWFVSNSDWSQKHYPPHCDIANGVVLSQEVARDLLMCSYFINRFWINDVFLTGILPQKMSIAMEPFPDDISITAMKNQYVHEDLSRTLFLTQGVSFHERTWRLLFTKSLKEF